MADREWPQALQKKKKKPCLRCSATVTRPGKTVRSAAITLEEKEMGLRPHWQRSLGPFARVQPRNGLGEHKGGWNHGLLPRRPTRRETPRMAS